MEIKSKHIITLIVVLTICITVFLVTVGFVIKNRKEHPKTWVLHSYGNNVALYNGENIIEVYGSINLNNLTEEDKRLLDNGIVFSTKEEAQSAIEDYDG